MLILLPVTVSGPAGAISGAPAPTTGVSRYAIGVMMSSESLCPGPMASCTTSPRFLLITDSNLQVLREWFHANLRGCLDSYLHQSGSHSRIPLLLWPSGPLGGLAVRRLLPLVRRSAKMMLDTYHHSSLRQWRMHLPMKEIRHVLLWLQPSRPCRFVLR